MNYRIISTDELRTILAKHTEWLADNRKGERANLIYADLRYVDLRSADLRSAILRYTNLSSADLSYTNLSSADLSYANLSNADLSSADLSNANLSYTNLSYTNLLIFQFNRNTAYFTLDGTLRIGCECMPISEWVLGYQEIGEKQGYSEIEIEAYGDFIRMCLKVFNSLNPKESER